MRLKKNIALYTIGATFLVSSFAANSGVIGNVGSQPYLAGDAMKAGSKLILSSGDAIINLDEGSSGSVSESPLTFKLDSGSGCVSLSSAQTIAIANSQGGESSFNAQNATSIAAKIVDGGVKYKEVTDCTAFAFANATPVTTTGAAVAGGSAGTGISSTLIGVGAAVILIGLAASDSDDNDDEVATEVVAPSETPPEAPTTPTDNDNSGSASPAA